MKTVLVTLQTLMLVALSASAGERLQVRVSHPAQFAPADVIVQAIVEPAADNRALEVIAESADFYRSSTVQLDGTDGPRVNSVYLRQLPSGYYDVIVRVLANDGSEIAAERETFFLA